MAQIVAKERIKYIKLVVFHIFLGAAFSFLYVNLTIPRFNEFNLKILEIRGEKSFDLPKQDTYLLKIGGHDVPNAVYCNSSKINYAVFVDRKKRKEFYFVLPSELVRKGENVLKIGSTNTYTANIKNCLSYTDFGVILLSSSAIKKQEINTTILVLFLLMLILFGFGVSFALEKLFGISLDKYFVKYALSYAPCLFLMTFLYNVFKLMPLHIFFFRTSFIGLSIFLVLIIQIPIFLSFIVELIKQVTAISKERKAAAPPVKKTFAVPPKEKKPLVSTVIATQAFESTKMLTDKLMGYRAVQWWLTKDLPDKCIIFFIFLLFFCTFLLSFHLDILAEIFANIAYLFLTTGVIIKLLHSSKNRGKPQFLDADQKRD